MLSVRGAREGQRASIVDSASTVRDLAEELTDALVTVGPRLCRVFHLFPRVAAHAFRSATSPELTVV